MNEASFYRIFIVISVSISFVLSSFILLCESVECLITLGQQLLIKTRHAAWTKTSLYVQGHIWWPSVQSNWIVVSFHREPLISVFMGFVAWLGQFHHALSLQFSACRLLLGEGQRCKLVFLEGGLFMSERVDFSFMVLFNRALPTLCQVPPTSSPLWLKPF